MSCSTNKARVPAACNATSKDWPPSATASVQVRQNPEDDHSDRDERQETRRRHGLTPSFR